MVLDSSPYPPQKKWWTNQSHSYYIQKNITISQSDGWFNSTRITDIEVTVNSGFLDPKLHPKPAEYQKNMERTMIDSIYFNIYIIQKDHKNKNPTRSQDLWNLMETLLLKLQLFCFGLGSYHWPWSDRPTAFITGYDADLLDGWLSGNLRWCFRGETRGETPALKKNMFETYGVCPNKHTPINIYIYMV